MKFNSLFALSATFAMALARPQAYTNDTTLATDAPVKNVTKFGMIVYPGFEPIDVFGPLNALQTLGRLEKISISILSEKLDPVSTLIPVGNPQNSSMGGIKVLPTHTYANPPDLDVLLVPGGVGSRDPAIESTISFIKATYPKLKYLLTICTGSTLVSQTGFLDGKKATTNKAQLAMGWNETKAKGPKVDWQPDARWVVAGNIWTSSGVSAGIDVTLAWIEATHGNATATQVSDVMEYTRHLDKNVDPFAVQLGVKPS